MLRVNGGKTELYCFFFYLALNSIFKKTTDWTLRKTFCNRKRERRKTANRQGKDNACPVWGWGMRAQHGVRGLASLLTAAVNIFQTIGKKAAIAAQRALANTMMLLSEGFMAAGQTKRHVLGCPPEVGTISSDFRGVYARPHSWLMHWETNWTAGGRTVRDCTLLTLETALLQTDTNHLTSEILNLCCNLNENTPCGKPAKSSAT